MKPRPRLSARNKGKAVIPLTKYTRVAKRNSADYDSATPKYKARRVVIQCFEGRGKGQPKERVLRHVTNCSPHRTVKAIRKWAKRKFYVAGTTMTIFVGKGHK